MTDTSNTTSSTLLSRIKADLIRIEAFFGIVGKDSEAAATVLTPLAEVAEGLSGAAALIPVTAEAGAALEAAGTAAAAAATGNLAGAVSGLQTTTGDIRLAD